MKNHPMQSVFRDEQGVIRFQSNAIVRFLLDEGPFDMNRLAIRSFSEEDRAQFAQLIGYSVSGFGDLQYVDRKTLRRADAKAERLIAEEKE